MSQKKLFDVLSESPVVALLRRKLSERGVPLSLGSVPECAVPFFVAYLSNNAKVPILLVTDGLKSQERLYDDLCSFLPEAMSFPAWESLPHEDVLPHSNTIADRLAVLNNHQPVAIVASVQALMQRTFEPEQIAQAKIQIQVGHQTDFQGLVQQLIDFAYHPEYQVSEPGDMSMRGGIIDFYPLDQSYPVRVEFNGEIIDSIRSFDPVSQHSIGKLEKIEVITAGEVGLLRKSQSRKASLLEHLPQETLLVLCEPEKLLEAANQYSHQVPNGDPFYVSWHEWIESKLTRIHLQEEVVENPLPDELDMGIVSMDTFRPLGLPVLTPEISDQLRHAFFDQIRGWSKDGYSVHLFFTSEGEQQRFIELWREIYLSDPKEVELYSNTRQSCGFLWPAAKIALVTGGEIFGRQKISPRRRKLHKQTEPLEWTELQEGDFVVHLQHGIGKYIGLKTIDRNTHSFVSGSLKLSSEVSKSVRHEVLAIEYANEARLYVPLEQAHLVTKYIGAGKRMPQLHQLGGTLWQRQKTNAEQAIMDLASGLLEVQAARDSLEGHAFAPDSPWQHEFEVSFPYEETEDQHVAIEEVKRDLESSKPMDRLICGDVGYGKTEVAIRAAFKTVMEGMQVAILVPTTILAEQHFNTFRDRVAGYPINVEMLSRFRTLAEQKKIVELLSAGAVDIVIGTHRLLSNDIRFKNLGLVVIDEEQRFGVLHKERFKQLRQLVDVLTLSATPIPRTLYLALTGARDLSTIQTPPQDRLPIETIVVPYDERLIRQAIQREINRGGQVYFLHNRVQSIDAVAAKLESLFSDTSDRQIRFGVGHGQMPEHALEEVMHRFVNGEVDVLVCTTIIESGLDIPNANTIIIDRADRFGLSDLYQLRGRVGRYKHQAYAYILMPRHMQLVSSARKRISAIRQYSSLGSGFKIAMRDLEIRGAGNILGAEQSGHITTIGFDLYCQLLKESVARLKGEATKRPPQVVLKFDFLSEYTDDSLARIPSSYINENRLRLSVYRRIAQAAERADIRSLRDELRDRFGALPREVKLLLRCAEIRILAGEVNLDSVETRNDKIMLNHREQYFQIDGKFPRLIGRTPDAKLNEVQKLIKSLANIW